MTSPSVAAPRPLPARATPDRARVTELVMLLSAVLIGTLAVVAVNLGTGRPWASHVGLFGGVFGLVFGLAHLGVRWWAPAADPLLLPLAARRRRVAVDAGQPPAGV